MKPAAILHLRSSSGLYGAEQMLLGLCTEQARLGAAPVLAAFAHPGPQPTLLAAAAAHGISSFALPCRGAIDLRCVRDLRAQLRHSPPRLLHCHDYKSVTYAYLASTGLRLHRVATVHGWVDDGARSRAYRALELRVLRGFDHVCAVSDGILHALRGAGLKEERIRRIDNGIDLDRFQVRATAGTGVLRLGIAARLSPEKNLEQLLCAISECRSRGARMQLTIHGEGPLRVELEASIKQLDLADCVTLPGARAALEDWYPELDALLLPSLSEGLPMSVLEALACGCPLVASDVGALPEVLSGLPGCALIRAGDLAELVAALMAVRPRVVADGRLRERVNARYSVARMAAAYEGVYLQALAA